MVYSCSESLFTIKWIIRDNNMSILRRPEFEEVLFLHETS